MHPRHWEQHRSERTGWLRAAVLGANDGIVSTTSLVHPDGGFYASEDADGGAVCARAQPAAHGHACAATHRLGHSSMHNRHEGSMRVQEMTKEAKTRLLCKASAFITSIDSAICPRVHNTTAQIHRHAMRSGGSKTHSL